MGTTRSDLAVGYVKTCRRRGSTLPFASFASSIFGVIWKPMGTIGLTVVKVLMQLAAPIRHLHRRCLLEVSVADFTGQAIAKVKTC